MPLDYVCLTSDSTRTNLGFILERNRLDLEGDPERPPSSSTTVRSLRAHSTHQNLLRHSQVSG